MKTGREKKATEKARAKRDAALAITHENRANTPESRADRTNGAKKRVRGG